MKFNKQSWDQTHFETVRELHPEMNDDEVREFVAKESQESGWLAYEEAFKKQLAKYSDSDLEKMMQECNGDVVKFNNMFFGIETQEE